MYKLIRESLMANSECKFLSHDQPPDITLTRQTKPLSRLTIQYLTESAINEIREKVI